MLLARGLFLVRLAARVVAVAAAAVVDGADACGAHHPSRHGRMQLKELAALRLIPFPDMMDKRIDAWNAASAWCGSHAAQAKKRKPEQERKRAGGAQRHAARQNTGPGAQYRGVAESYGRAVDKMGLGPAA